MNLPRAYQTDPVVIEGIGTTATSRKMGLYILLHGNPCQWDYHLRPWIYFEHDISGTKPTCLDLPGIYGDLWMHS